MERQTVKRVVFVSNYFHHHQKPFSDEMFKHLGDGYMFLETSKMTEERKNLGWGLDTYPSYVYPCDIVYKQESFFKQKINEADVVIIGSAPESFIEERKKQKKLIFRYSERPLKKGIEPLKFLPRLIKWRKKNPAGCPIHMLCASAYTASDYAKFGLFKDKCYKWGYFTEVKHYDNIDALIDEKQENSIVWVARFIKFKHPEFAVKVARLLKDDGYSFKIKMIGIGPCFEAIQDLIKRLDLDDYIELLGAMKPYEVREHMEKSEVFLFTSDRNEGWGAVLNEAMNSACAVVTSHAIGATPFLVQNGQNGLVYESENVNDLYHKVRSLLDDKEMRKTLSKNAYETMKSEWNPKNAASKLIKLFEAVINGENINACSSGVCSKAEKMKDNWIKNER